MRFAKAFATRRPFFLVLVVAFFLAGCSHTADLTNKVVERDSQGTSEKAPLAAEIDGRFVRGQPAPGMVASSFDGERVDLSEFYGERAVILDFWAGWCPFCVEEMPELQRTQEQYSDSLVVVGVHRTDTETISIGLRFAESRDVSYLLIQDGDGSLYRASGGVGMPVAVFIDRRGVVTEVKSGPKTAEEIAQKVERLL